MKKVVGIVLLVLGILSIIGGIGNGTLLRIFSGNIYNAVSDMTTIICMIAMIVGGIVLIIKGKK